MGGSCSSKASQQVQDENLIENQKLEQKKKEFKLNGIQLDAVQPSTYSQQGLISDKIALNQLNSLTKEFEELLRQFKTQGGQFSYKDQKFLPILSSITKNIDLFMKGNELIWKKPSNYLDISKNQLNLFGENELSISEIKQGILENHYFLSAIALLLEADPFLIKRLFLSKQINQYGCYSLYLNHEGTWKEQILDDYIPCFEDNRPAFTHNKDQYELWMILLEKAYAKQFGAYDKIENGLVGPCVRDLTGGVYKYFVRDQGLDKEDEFPDFQWEWIKEHLDKGYRVVCSQEKNDRFIEIENFEQTEIDNFHLGSQIAPKNKHPSSFSYFVLETAQVTDNNDIPARIIKIKNPWSQGHEWTGDWWQQSEKWSDFWRKELKVDSQEEDTYWQDVAQFSQFYPQCCAIYINSDYFYSSQAVQVGLNEFNTKRIFLMQIFEDKADGFVTVSQKDERNWLKNEKVCYNYSLCQIVLAKVNSKNYQIEQFINDSIECERDVNCEVQKLEKGNYLVYVEIDWVQNYTHDFVVSFYGNQTVSFKELKQNQANTVKFLDDLIFEHQKIQPRNRIHSYNEEIFKVNSSVGGYVYFYYENNDEYLVLRETVYLKKRIFLLPCNNFDEEKECFSVEIPPNGYKLIKFKVDPLGRGEYNYQLKVKSILLEDLGDNEELMKEKALNNPSKIQQREMNGYFMEVYVHTYFYYGGVIFLYINRTKSRTYVEDLSFSLTNLEHDDFNDGKQCRIEIPPKETYLINLKQINKKLKYFYKMEMSYFLR